MKVNVIMTIAEYAWYAWMCPFEQDSEYALGPKYTKILNTAKFWTWLGFQYASLTQHSKYGRISLDRVPNIS